MNTTLGPWATAVSAEAGTFWQRRLVRLADPRPSSRAFRWHRLVMASVTVVTVFAPTLRSTVIAGPPDETEALRPASKSQADKSAFFPIAGSPKTEREKHVEKMILLRGAAALRRAAASRPAWGDSLGGLQVGIGTSNEKRRVMAGGKLDLEFYIRNVSCGTIRIQIHIWGWPFDFERNVPHVVDPAGKRVNVTGQAAWPAGIYPKETLQPDEVVIVAHPGLWLSTAPVGRKTVDLKTGLPKDPADGYPFIVGAVPGDYKLTQSVTVARLAVNDSEDPKGLALTTGELGFHVVALPVRAKENKK